jgi:hypothetical protein
MPMNPTFNNVGPQVLVPTSGAADAPFRQADLNSIIANMVDYRLAHQWDTTVITGGSTIGLSKYSPFGEGQNSGPSPVSATTTSLRQPNQFPSPECMIMDYLGFYFTPNALKSDLALFVANYRWEFRINRKMMFEGLMWMQPPGYAIYGESTQNNESAWFLGPSSAGPMGTIRFGDYARFIGPNQGFYMDLICDGTPPTFTGPNFSIITFLHGIYGVAVQ